MGTNPAASALIGFTVALAALSGPATEPVAQPDYAAESAAILADQIDRAAAGRPCVQPTELPAGVIPRYVVVSPWNGGRVGGWASNTAELESFDRAWADAKALRVAVRCVIV